MLHVAMGTEIMIILLTSIQIFSDPGRVTSLSELSQNSTTVTFHWNPPLPNTAPITSYEVTYWLSREPHRAKSTNVTREETTFHLRIPAEAKANDELIFSVRVFGRYGAGSSENISTFITLPHLSCK